jgi:hypothetical protein
VTTWLVFGVLLTAVVFVLAFSVLVVVLSRKTSPSRQARQRAIAALCAQRGLLPGAVQLSSEFGLLNPIDHRGVENPFSSPDGSVAAADLWRGTGRAVELICLVTFTVAGLNVPRVAVMRRYRIDVPPLWGPHPLEMESGDFDKRFTVWTKDRRSAVMLLDQGMMQWLLDCEEVNFEMFGNRVLAFVFYGAEPSHPPSEPVEYELLFKFYDGFLARVPPILPSEYPASQ